MTRSRGKQGFFLPGGKRNPEESDHAALQREILEELSAEIDPGSLQAFKHYVEQAFEEPDGVKVSLRTYLGVLTRSPVPTNEIAEIRWRNSRKKHLTDCRSGV